MEFIYILNDMSENNIKGTSSKNVLKKKINKGLVAAYYPTHHYNSDKAALYYLISDNLNLDQIIVIVESYFLSKYGNFKLILDTYGEILYGNNSCLD